LLDYIKQSLSTFVMVDWSGGQATPRKYKPIFFVRCHAVGAFLILREKQQGFLVGRAVRSPSPSWRSHRKRFLLPRKLKRCPRKATARSGNQRLLRRGL